MDRNPPTPASTSPVTRVLALGVFACVGGGLATLLAGASGHIAAAALVFGAILTISAVVFEHRRAPEAFSLTARSPLEVPHDLIPAPLLDPGGERWISVDPAYAAFMKRKARMAHVAPILPLLLWLWMQHAIMNPSVPVAARAAGRILEIMVGGMILASVVALLFIRHRVKRRLLTRIGADRTHLLHDPGTGEIERHEWSSVLTDKFHLLIGRRILPLVRPSGLRQMTVFPAEGLRALILPRLPAASFMARGQFVWNALRRGNRFFWAIAAALCSLLVLQVLMKQYPEWFKAAREAVQAWALASVS